MRRLFALLFLVALPLNGEIISVSVQWRGFSCNTTCVQMLEQSLRTTPGVASVAIHPTESMATMGWMPNVPFTSQPIQLALRRVGPGIDVIQVKVRGTIQVQNNGIWLLSSGDNTPFLLLGLPPGQPLGTVLTRRSSFTNFPLSPDMQAQLLAAAREGRVTVVEGPLLQFERSPPPHADHHKFAICSLIAPFQSCLNLTDLKHFGDLFWRFGNLFNYLII